MQAKKSLLSHAMLVASLVLLEPSYVVAAADGSSAAPLSQQSIQLESLVMDLVDQIHQDPDNIKTHLIYAGRNPLYSNTLEPGDLELLLADNGEDVADVAEGLLEQSPHKLISVHTEVIGKVSLERLNEVESMIRSLVINGRINVDEGSLAFNPAPLWPKVLIGAGVVAGVAVAAGGGSGGGDSSTPFVVPSFAVTASYSADYGHSLIGTEQAHDRGYDGSGVIVGVMDTGFLSTHTELNGQFLDLYNVFNGASGAAASGDSDGHGTHVAGIIAAKRDATDVTGVAPGAQLVGIRMGDVFDRLSATDVQMARGVDFAVAQGSAFVNNSWGLNVPINVVSASDILSTDALLLQAYRDAATADTVMVFSNGNDRETYPSQPAVFAGLPVLFPELADHWVAVGSVGADGLLASYSQPCGMAANWCLVAPGGDDDQLIKSAYNNGGYALMAGTSMAAPVVTGALAVLKQRFPTLSNDLVVDRLFLTANKSGIYANTTTYGQGLVDLDKATDPLGPLSVVNPIVSTQGGVAALPLSSLRLESSAAFGGSLNRELQSTSLAVADIQGAGFFIELGDLAKSNYQFDLERAVARLDTQVDSYQLPLTTHSSLQVALDGSEGLSNTQDLTGMVYRYQTSQAQVRLGLTDRLQQFVTQPISHSVRASHSFAAFLTPYISAEQALWGADFSVQHGALRWGLTALAPQGDREDDNQPDSQLAIISLTLQASDALDLSLQLGYGAEQQGVLGAEFDGALALDDSTPFGYTGIQGVYRLSQATHISAAAYLGQTRPEVKVGSLINQVSNLVSSSFALGLSHQLDKQQQLGLVVSQPLRVERGQMSLVLSTGYEGNQFNRETKSLDLAASARQIDYELFYQLAKGRDTGVKASFIYQTNPGHQRKSANGVLLLSADQQF
ncbi:MAG: S8 family peptidase [Halopseudomonas sp.]